MKTGTKNKILHILKHEGPQRPADLVGFLAISPQALHRHLAQLRQAGRIVKLGTSPKVFYKLAEVAADFKTDKLTKEEIEIIENNFSELLSNGNLVYGLDGFKQWLLKTKQKKAYKSLAAAYLKQKRQADAYRNQQGEIDLLQKINDTFGATSLDGAICQDFYSIPQFGKTVLGDLLTAAKSGQDKDSLRKISKLFEPFLHSFIDRNKVKTLVWTPHSISRELMFLPELRKNIALSLPAIEAVKVFSGSIPVAQKSLSKLQDRIDNARDTIFFPAAKPIDYGNVAIIDDALGSGATLNAIAEKLKKQYAVKKVYGVTVVGSYKGFDIISVV